MILGTSKILSKSGPTTLPIITKMFQKIQEKYGIILEEYHLCQYGTNLFGILFEKMYVLGTMCVVAFSRFFW